MKIGILQCDSVLEKFQGEFGDYPGMIHTMFGSVEGLYFQTFDVRNGDYPEFIENWDLFLISGSKASVYDGEPWIEALIAFVQRLNLNHKKTFGICFGHQIMAMATGGCVEKSTKGWGVGVAQSQIVSRLDWMAFDSDESTHLEQINIIVSHQDQVTVLSEGAEVIASSEFCPYFIVQWSPSLLSIQGHPEWSKGYSRVLINDRLDRIPADRVAIAMESYAAPLHAEQVVSWILQFARASSSS